MDLSRRFARTLVRVRSARLALFEVDVADRSRVVRPSLGVAQTRRWKLPGVEFIDENGGGPGVRLRKRQRAKPSK